MKKSAIKLLIILTGVLVSVSAANAKWWIFGGSKAAVSINYLYVNQISWDETDATITLYQSFLPDGLIDIRGKAMTDNGIVGSVQISIDGRKTWRDAKLSSNGSFEFSFRPETGKSYECYVRIMDTRGKTNDVDSSRKLIFVSDKNIAALVTETLNNMIAAYESEDGHRFMTCVSPDFAGDELNLDNAVHRDFAAFDDINLDFSLTNVAAGSNGYLYATLTYTRFLVSAKSGTPFRDRGLTEFVFKTAGGIARVYSMKMPLIFGLSDAAEVATGAVLAGINNQILVVDDTGNVRKVTIEEAVNGDNGGEGGIPAPTNLTVVTGVSHHFIDLEFDSPLDFAEGQAYEVVIEEALSASGPWNEVARKPFDTYIPSLTTDAIAQMEAILYYRVKLLKISTGEQSTPSNVAQWDNR